jgi:pantothenate synthetase
VELRGAEQLEPLSEASPIAGQCVITVAAYCGVTRLIDNVVLGMDELPTVVVEAQE